MFLLWELLSLYMFLWARKLLKKEEIQENYIFHLNLNVLAHVTKLLWRFIFRNLIQDQVFFQHISTHTSMSLGTQYIYIYIYIYIYWTPHLWAFSPAWANPINPFYVTALFQCPLKIFLPGNLWFSDVFQKVVKKTSARKCVKDIFDKCL